MRPPTVRIRSRRGNAWKLVGAVRALALDSCMCQDSRARMDDVDALAFFGLDGASGEYLVAAHAAELCAAALAEEPEPSHLQDVRRSACRRDYASIDHAPAGGASPRVR